MTRAEVASTIKAKVADYWREKMYAVSAEVGLNKGGSLRADVLAVHMKNEIVMVEVKSCLADFRNDRKWPQYLKYCNRLFFAVGAATYEKIKADIPPEVGVFVIRSYLNKKYSYKRTAIRMVRSAKHREIDPSIMANVAIRMAYRGADMTRFRVNNRIK
ncbi:hypothetical protein BcepSauron_250 [Burkholderia phage BcepSauron]|uniref:MmcB family DNA repair protein n=1 Tax=Burkholderia phage BcepSauron TaxID=2530033 RepID=A0A482MNE3_9CAUD|nr:hypothetical protein H1O17_gp250 [Burkholderia phage BcepSauron]QBQ74630.1 hypothetical protein BcepSauron_250 [Burkholderia phage BcepSauron]